MALKKNIELKVGIFVFIGLIILSIIVFSIGNIYFFKPRYNIKVKFNSVSGIEDGAQVKLSGVKIGEVEKVKINYNNEFGKIQVELVVLVDCNIKIPRDSYAYINTLSLLGEKYLEISPGATSNDFLKEGDVLVGMDSVSMREIIEVGDKIAVKLNQIVESIDYVVSDPEVKESLKTTLKNSSEMIMDFKNFVASASRVLDKIEKGEGTIGKLISDDKIYEDLKYLVEDLKKNPWKLLRKSKVDDKKNR